MGVTGNQGGAGRAGAQGDGPQGGGCIRGQWRAGVAGGVHGLDAEGVAAAGGQPGDVIAGGGDRGFSQQCLTLVDVISGYPDIVGGRWPA
ncbi:MAG: hypothetical protein A4E52_00557 [Pelotomaculum sp. PtaB.Bin013]|nr:MAG: hypothetical protein A4E52_00557 [Pelotomaculum sp. PtaB.Bin013]